MQVIKNPYEDVPVEEFRGVESLDEFEDLVFDGLGDDFTGIMSEDLGPEIRGHDHDCVAKVDFDALGIGQEALVEDLQKQVGHICHQTPTQRCSYPYAPFQSHQTKQHSIPCVEHPPSKPQDSHHTQRT